MSCSVEKLDQRRRDEHDVVRQHLQHHLLALGCERARADGGAEVALDHADRRLDLPALAEAVIAVALHPPTVRAGGGLGAGAADAGGNHAAHAAAVTREAVIRLAVVAGVGQDRADAPATSGAARRGAANLSRRRVSTATLGPRVANALRIRWSAQSQIISSFGYVP